jgi:2-polyprenyl-3-methyl-5-hydroxy-6-metoxy-1,4-benzoquinol methylase
MTKYGEPRNKPLAKGNLFHKYSYEIDKIKYIFASRFVKNKKIINVACGEGYSSTILSRANPRFITNIDLDLETIKKAKEKYGNDKCEFICQDAESLVFKENSFDTAISMETIEHFKDPNKFLSDLKKITKPSSIIVISTPNGSFTNKVGFKMSPFHVKEYTTNEMKSIIQKHFTVNDIFHQIPFNKNFFLLKLNILYALLFRIKKIKRRNHSTSGIFNIYVCKNEKR